MIGTFLSIRGFFVFRFLIGGGRRHHQFDLFTVKSEWIELGGGNQLCDLLYVGAIDYMAIMAGIAQDIQAGGYEFLAGYSETDAEIDDVSEVGELDRAFREETGEGDVLFVAESGDTIEEI